MAMTIFLLHEETLRIKILEPISSRGTCSRRTYFGVGCYYYLLVLVGQQLAIFFSCRCNPFLRFRGKSLFMPILVYNYLTIV